MVLLNRSSTEEKWTLTLLDSNHTSSDPNEDRSRLELMQYLIVRQCLISKVAYRASGKS